jgi:hypothetical protein
MKERPILFSGPMVAAILDGRKTQTRRIIKPQPRTDVCPYGVPGDRLWVKETWAIVCAGEVQRLPAFEYEKVNTKDLSAYLDPECDLVYRADVHNDIRGWRPPRYMPKWASRILLEITGVRVERVQDIGEADAKAEGCMGGLPVFSHLWDSIHKGKEGREWEANPWVWVIEFKRVEGT